MNMLRNLLLVITLLLGINVIHQVQGCIGGRYGRYENWPTQGDWDELLLLLTGKYNGNGGWGWQSTDSYAYNGFADYPYGSSGSSGGSNGFFTSATGTTLFFGSSKNGGSQSSSTSGASVNTNKMKKALSDYFNSHKKHHVSTNNAGGVGQVFHDTPGPSTYSQPEPYPGPPAPSHYSKPPTNFQDDGPPLPAGPPYDSSPPLSGWSGNSGPPDYQWPPSSEPVKIVDHYHYDGPSPTLGYNHNSNHNSDNTNRHKNLFQTDHEVFGTKKRRRNGKRRLHSKHSHSPEKNHKSNHGINGQAGLPTKPKRPSKRIPFKRRSHRKQRTQFRRRIARRKLKTTFGGYKLDLSRFKFW